MVTREDREKLLGLWVSSVNTIHFYKLYLHSITLLANFNMAVRKRRPLKPSAPLPGTWCWDGQSCWRV